MTMTPAAQDYQDALLDGSQVASKWTRKAAERHERDLEQAKGKAWPYEFRPTLAERAIKFIQFLPFTKGPKAGERFLLSPWQEWIVNLLFGWVRKTNGHRRFTSFFLLVARKNGKTTFGAAILLYMMVGDGEAAPECYTLATKRDQAKICWEEAGRMINNTPELAGRLQVWKHSITYNNVGGKFEPLASEAKRLDGLNPHGVLIDEFHEIQDTGLEEVMRSGQGARSQPLLMIITTSGFHLSAPAFKEWERTQRILDGVDTDDRHLVVPYVLDEEDDWQDPETWAKANPNLDVSVTREFLENELVKVKNNPQKLAFFQVKNLNIWQNSPETWIPHEVFMAGSGEPYTEEELEGRPCYAGLDLSSHKDLSALALVFPPQDEGEPYKVVLRAWLPEDGIQEREQSDKVPYTTWAANGLLRLTRGTTIDFHDIEDEIERLALTYDIYKLGYDPFMAKQLVYAIEQKGVEIQPIKQHFLGLGTMAKAYHQAIDEGRIAHQGHPILTWCQQCTDVIYDNNGNPKPVKPKRHRTAKRIDLVVALIMGYGLAIDEEAEAVSEGDFFMVGGEA